MVSVIIPAFNCERYISDAINSVIAQTYKNLEVIIINDASTDKTSAVAHSLTEKLPNMCVYNNETNMGVAETRNQAINLAKGKYIAFLDADDRWLPDKIEHQLSYIKRAGVDLCYTAYTFINEHGRKIRRSYNVPETITFKGMLCENVIGLSSVVVKREVIGNKRMKPEYAHEDYVFWLELLKSGCKMGGINEQLMEYRICASNRSGNKVEAARNRLDIYRRFIKMGIFKTGFFMFVYLVNGLRKKFF